MAQTDKPITNGSPLKITMSSMRLTGDQSQRLLEIHRAKALECYAYWDWRLRDLGLVAIGAIPPNIKTAQQKRIAAMWIKVRKMSGVKTPTPATIKELGRLLNQMDHATYRLDKKFSTLTEAGKKLAENGRAVLLPKDTATASEYL